MIIVRQFCFLILALVIFSGCEKYYVTVKREYVDRDQLASTFVGSPDPRQENPPRGQELTIEWRLPPEAMGQTLQLELSVLYRDYSHATFTYPIDRRRGVVIYSLLNEEYFEKEGLLTYKAEIVDVNRKILKEWKQILWTDLITLEEPETEIK